MKKGKSMLINSQYDTYNDIILFKKSDQSNRRNMFLSKNILHCCDSKKIRKNSVWENGSYNKID